MNAELVKRLLFSYKEKNESFSLPLPIKDALRVIAGFFLSNSNNKLCIVFPSKEYAAQWLSIPIVLSWIQSDFAQHKNEINETYKDFAKRDKLMLNGKAIVEWHGINERGVTFKTKGIGESSGAEITIGFADVMKLQKVNATRMLSSLKTVREILPQRNITPLEKLLNIDTYGNKEFIKNKLCLVTKYKSFDNSIDDVVINQATLPKYFDTGKIDENGISDSNSPLLLSNNLSNLALYSITNPIATIIIDGFAAIQERRTDFSDIDVKKIPTILITDLSEIENFEFIGNYGFEFFNFTKENLNLDQQPDSSPFYAFTQKQKKYIHLNVIKEICQDSNIEIITQKIHSIEKDESNNDLTTLKVYLIQLANVVSRIAHIPTFDEISTLNHKLNIIETLFFRSRTWLGDSHNLIEESISLLKLMIQKFASQASEKCAKLKSLLSQHKYDYIICPTEDEAQALKTSLSPYTQMQVISVSDVNNNLLTNKPVKAIITGWAKSTNVNRILSSFLFSELTLLFYQFENKYYNSLQRRNKKYNENIKATINNKGIRLPCDSEKPKGFDDFYSNEEVAQTITENSFDNLDFELKLENAQYSKYLSKGNLIDSIKAKRIDFENDLFIYSSESHKFLVVNELIEKHSKKENLRRIKLDALNLGDVIAFINTDRDILAELVETNTNKQDLGAVKQWTNLWKNLLKKYFASLDNNFKKLVDDLRKHDCKKHEVTIRTWLQDENIIGPDDDSDLISIASMTNSKLLYENIGKVREAIRKMTGWRMKVSDFISDKIKARIHEFADSSSINKKISVEGLGSIFVLKLIEISNTWENIDVRYVNKLLQKESI